MNPPPPRDALRALLATHDADAALITHLPDIRWACGFTGSNGLLVVRPDAAHFVSDGRYDTQARREVTGAEVHIPGYDLYGHIAEAGLLDGAETIVVQADHLTLADEATLRAAFPAPTWKPVKHLLARHRAAKTEAEIDRIRQAQALTDCVFDHLLGLLRPGMTEREVAAEIVYAHLGGGAERMSFDPIVASGPNSALPHARPTDRALRAGELVLLDFGCFRDGYASDMTRTVALGDPGDDARAVYALVAEAQARALDAARAGMTTKALDAAARDVIAAAGYGAAFSHSLGHGVGLEIHEWPPVSYRTEDVLPAGAVVTIEPGIYLADRFGVRIEDLIVLRDGGAENLTAAPKNLLLL